MTDAPEENTEGVQPAAPRRTAFDVIIERRERIVDRLCRLECNRWMTEADREAVIVIFKDEHAVSSDAAFLHRNDSLWAVERWQWKVHGVMVIDPHGLYSVLGEG